MFLEEFYNSDIGKSMNKLARESCTYNAAYVYWRDQLFERAMRLFVWENTGDVEPKEIEQRLILNGHCGITTIPKDGAKLTAMFGSFFTPTKYMDEWKNYTVRCPIYSGTRTIFKGDNKNGNVVVISNNALRNPVFPLIHHYAIMLAHTEVSYIDAVVNVRDAGGAPVAATEKQKQSISEYIGKKFNGQYGIISDPGQLGVNYAGASSGTNQDIATLYECRNKILKNFYSDLGVRSAFEKRSNTITEEVEADTSLLLLNLADMLDARQKGAELVNQLYGTNWTVHIAEELQYDEENEVKEEEVPEDGDSK